MALHPRTAQKKKNKKPEVNNPRSGRTGKHCEKPFPAGQTGRLKKKKKRGLLEEKDLGKRGGDYSAKKESTYQTAGSL